MAHHVRALPAQQESRLDVGEELEAQALRAIAGITAQTGTSRRSRSCFIANEKGLLQSTQVLVVLNGPAESVEPVPYRVFNHTNVFSMESRQSTTDKSGNTLGVRRARSPGMFKSEDVAREVAGMLNRLDQDGSEVVLHATPSPVPCSEEPMRPSSAHRKMIEALQRSTEAQLLLASQEKRHQVQQTRKPARVGALRATRSMRDRIRQLEARNDELQTRNASLDSQYRQSQLLGVALLRSSLESSTIQQMSLQSMSSKNGALCSNTQRLQLELETLQRCLVDAASVSSAIGSIIISSSAAQQSRLIHENEELHASNQELKKRLESLSERWFFIFAF